MGRGGCWGRGLWCSGGGGGSGRRRCGFSSLGWFWRSILLGCFGGGGGGACSCLGVNVDEGGTDWDGVTFFAMVLGDDTIESGEDIHGNLVSFNSSDDLVGLHGGSDSYADGKNVFKVDRNNKVMWRNGYPGFFMMDKTAGRDIVYEDGLVAMSGLGARRLGSMGAAPSGSDSPPPASSEPEEEPAEKIPLREVSVSESGDQIYAVDVENTLWHTTGINRPWVKVTVPGGMTSVSVTKEDTLWTINMNGKPAWRDGADADFMELSGDLMYVESSADETAVWGANSLHIMFWRRGREPGSFWNPLPPTESRAKQISVSGDGSHVWYVNRNNDVFYRTGFETPQQEFPGVKLKQVAVSADGNHVWGVTDERDVWYRPGTSGDWTPVEAPALDYISLNGDGGMLYGVNMETGSTWYRFC